MVCWNISVRLVEREKCQKIKQWIFRGSLTEANFDYSIQHSDKELILYSSSEKEPHNEILKVPKFQKKLSLGGFLVIIVKSMENTNNQKMAGVCVEIF